MKTLLAKEIRQMLPAFGMALLLVIAPFWLLSMSTPDGENSANLTFPLLCFGTLMMALTSFGREFGMGTFPLLLALPLDRKRIWWMKMAVLGTGMALVFGVYLLTLLPASYLPATKTLWFGDLGAPAGLVITFIVIIASGLWTTLLLRQIVAAFWFAVLIPTAILTLILWNGGRLVTAQIALVLYAIAGFWWARHQFYWAQEVAWTGGEVNLPAWQSGRASVRSAGRTYRPLAALLWKELQLFQVALLGMAGLFVLHLGVIALRKSLRGDNENGVLYTALTFFGGLWLIVPLITGSLNVADERRLGTLEAHLCLPVSRRVQFVIKLLVMLLLSGLLCAFLLWLAERIADDFHVGAGIGGSKLMDADELVLLSWTFVGFSLLVFYASTLARNILQAVVTAVILVLVFALASVIAANIGSITGILFWDGPLLPVIAVPTMVFALIWLAYGNFRRLPEARRLWWRNARGLAGAMLFAGALTTLVCHRAWELITPLEPPHGPARLSLSQPPELKLASAISVLSPDGRLWLEDMAFDQGRHFYLFGEALTSWNGRHGMSADVGFWLDSHLMGTKGNHYLEGSNWVTSETLWQTVGIRSDGTLWISEKKVPSFLWPTNGHPIPQRPANEMVRFGSDRNWKSVVRADNKALLLLKTDGTLWLWKAKYNKNYGDADLNGLKPKQVGTESDWSELLSSPRGMFGRSDSDYWPSGAFVWKKDSRAWRFVFPTVNPANPKIPIPFDIDPTLCLARWPGFDNTKWRSLAGEWPFQLGVRDDGTLWLFDEPAAKRSEKAPAWKPPVQIGTDRDWRSVGEDYRMIVALKTNGTLWKWDKQSEWRYDRAGSVTNPPARLGAQSDWVAMSGFGMLWSLSADGTLWCWTPLQEDSWMFPTRKPAKFDNIFSQQ